MAAVRNLMVRAGADFSAITKQASKASQSMRGMQNSVSRSCNAMAKAGAGLKKAFMAVGAAVSVRAIVNFAKEAAEAYDEQVENEVRLAQVMRNTMGARNDEIQSILDLAEAQQQLGVIDGDAQIAGAQKLATYLDEAASLEKLIPAMNDLAAQQFGLNVSSEQAATIATMFGKVMNGNVAVLNRYGISFDEAQANIMKFGSEAERAAVLAQAVEKSVGGMNQALANTPTGRMKQLSNTMADIKKQFGMAARTIGTVLLPVLNTIAKVLAAVATLANKVAQTIANVFGGKAAGKEWEYLPPSTAAVIDDAADATDNLTQSTNNAAAAAKKAKEAFQQASFDTLHILTEADTDESSSSAPDYSPIDSGVADSAENTADMIREVGTASEEAGEGIGWLQNMLEKVKKVWADFKSGLDLSKLKDAWDKLKESVSGFVSVISGVFSSVWERVLKPFGQWTINEALPAIIEVLAGVFDVLGAVIEKLRPAFEWLWDNFLEKIAHWAGDLFISALKEIAEQLQNIAKVIRGDMSLRDFIAQLNPLEKILLAVAAAFVTIKTAMLAVKAVEFVATIAKWVTGLKGFISVAGEVVASSGGIREAFIACQGSAATTFTGIGASVGGATLAVSAFVDAWQNGSSLITTAIEAIGLAIAAVGAVLLGAPAAVAAAVAGVVFIIANVAADIHTHWDEIKAWGAETAASVRDSFTSGWNDIKAEGQALWDSTVESFNGLKEAGIGVWDGIKTAAASAGEGIRSTFQSAVEKINAAIEKMIGLFDGMKEAAARAVDGMKQAWNGAADWFKTNVSEPLKEWGKQAWEDVKSAAQTAAEKVRETWNGLRSTLKSTWNDIKTTGSNAWNTIRDTAQQAWDAAYQGAAKAWESAKSGAASAWETVKTTWGQAGNYFNSSVFQPLIDAVKGGIEKVQSVFSGLSNVVENVVKKVREGISNLKSSVPSLEDVRNSISSAVGTISSKVSSVISSAKNLVTTGLANFNSLGLPHLAAGAVIPPNREFTAVLGDQHTGYNIETPEGLLREVVREESGNGAVLMILADILDAVREGKEITVDGYTLGKTVQRSMAMSARASGIA